MHPPKNIAPAASELLLWFVGVNHASTKEHCTGSKWTVAVVCKGKACSHWTTLHPQQVKCDRYAVLLEKDNLQYVLLEKDNLQYVLLEKDNLLQSEQCWLLLLFAQVNHASTEECCTKSKLTVGNECSYKALQGLWSTLQNLVVLVLIIPSGAIMQWITVGDHSW